MNGKYYYHVPVIYVLSILLGSILLQSCAYMKKRGNDALDMFDIGVTITPKAMPDGALYIDFFNMTPLGASHVDGKLLGIGYRQAGFLDYQSENWGVLAYGSEKQGAGAFNPNDPRHARKGETPEKDWTRHDAGFIGVFTGDTPPPKYHYKECSRMVHIGWIGIMLDIRPVDIADFILGWSTLDIQSDDNIPKPEKK